LLGTNMTPTCFPLLIKLINAKEKLSVQVHPDDEYACAVEGTLGKTEAWYVVEAQEGATITVGLKKPCTREEFQRAIEQGCLHQYLNEISVQKGNFFFIDSGTIHAIGAGVILVEIQQNSDITYRVYDYNRGRELHIEKALDVVDLCLMGTKAEGMLEKHEGFSKQRLCSSKYFFLERYEIDTYCQETSDSGRFFILTCVEGDGEVQSNNSCPKVSLRQGESILVPASLGKYTMIGRMKLLKSYIPDEAEVSLKRVSIFP
jgi:mannose-6-phosphate isomerase